jgi:hypothetical protein
MEFVIKDSNKFYLECDCGHGMIKIEIDKDDEYGIYAYIDYLEPVFYTKQDGIWNIIKERFYLAWKMLTGKQYVLYELVLNKEKFEEYRKFINKI